MEENNTKKAKLDVELTLDALGLDEEVEDVEEDEVENATDSNNNDATTPQASHSSQSAEQIEKVSEKSLLVNPAAGLFVNTASPGVTMGELYLGGGLDNGLESPAERIALTPVRKLPPGSGMRKVR